MADLAPRLALLCLGPRPALPLPLSVAQAAILVSLGLRRDSTDAAAKALGLAPTQLLAMWNKTARKAAAALDALYEAELDKTIPRARDAAAAAEALRPLQARPLAEELAGPVPGDLSGHVGPLAQFAIGGSEAEWQTALGDADGGGDAPQAVRVKASAAEKKRRKDARRGTTKRPKR